MATENERVLVVLAHPDDPEFFCGATLAKWARQGKEIHYLLLTCGDKGSDDPAMTPDALCADRQVEQRAAGDVVGVKDIRFLDNADGELTNTPAVRREIVREIRRVQPRIVVTSDPLTYLRANMNINHGDHRAAGAATLDALFPAAGNRMYFPELLEQGLEPYAPKEVWLAISTEPNMWVNVTDTIDAKIAAIRAHKSQVKDPESIEKRMRERHLRQDFDEPIYTESFRVIRFP